jgi:hypothetical protein
MKSKRPYRILTLVAFAAASASGATVSINFTNPGEATSTMAASDVAGAPGVAAASWNNYQSGTVSGPLVHDSGAATTATVTTIGGLGNWGLPEDANTSEDRMWKGLFETNGDTASVTVASLNYAAYEVHVYFDGDNGSNWRTANYSIGTDTRTAEDSENTNWGTGQNTAKVYQQPLSGTANANDDWPLAEETNNEGNYLVFSGLSDPSFTLNFDGGNAATGTQRAVVNGIQIVQVPEPSVTLLGGLGLFALLRRRR